MIHSHSISTLHPQRLSHVPRREFLILGGGVSLKGVDHLKVFFHCEYLFAKGFKA